jgi:hypothetical protein
MSKTLQRLSHIVALCLLGAIALITAISFFSSRWGWKIYLELQGETIKIQSRTQPERQSNGMLALEVTQPNQINFLKTTMK